MKYYRFFEKLGPVCLKSTRLIIRVKKRLNNNIKTIKSILVFFFYFITNFFWGFTENSAPRPEKSLLPKLSPKFGQSSKNICTTVSCRAFDSYTPFIDHDYGPRQCVNRIFIILWNAKKKERLIEWKFLHRDDGCIPSYYQTSFRHTRLA